VPEAPYRGIRPFRNVDRAIFLARQREERELLDLVTVYRGTMLYGASGTGKSSLVNAGFAPAASELGMQVERLRVQPRAGQELVLHRFEDDRAEYEPSLLADEDDRGSRSILSVAELAQRLRAAGARGRPVLVLDQFEELVTLFDEARAGAVRQRILDVLTELMRGSLPVKLLFVFREDYLGRIKQLLADCPGLVDQALRLEPPAPESLMTLIRGPFERNPGMFDREISPALATMLEGALAERFAQGDVTLTEVQTVCLRLWRAEDPETLLLQRGTVGLLEDYLGEALEAFPSDVRRASVALLAQMVTPAGTRNVISGTDLVERVSVLERIPRTLLERALHRLEVESRLVRRERRRELDLYELASEFLAPWVMRQREHHRLLRERRRLLMLAVIAAAALLLAVISALAAWAFASAPG
jgi:hypothetical protein